MSLRSNSVTSLHSTVSDAMLSVNSSNIPYQFIVRGLADGGPRAVSKARGIGDRSASKRSAGGGAPRGRHRATPSRLLGPRNQQNLTLTQPWGIWARYSTKDGAIVSSHIRSSGRSSSAPKPDATEGALLSSSSRLCINPAAFIPGPRPTRGYPAALQVRGHG